MPSTKAPAQSRFGSSRREGPVADGAAGSSAIGVDDGRQDRVEAEVPQRGASLSGADDLGHRALPEGERRRCGTDDGAQP